MLNIVLQLIRSRSCPMFLTTIAAHNPQDFFEHKFWLRTLLTLINRKTANCPSIILVARWCWVLFDGNNSKFYIFTRSAQELITKKPNWPTHWNSPRLSYPYNHQEERLLSTTSSKLSAELYVDEGELISNSWILQLKSFC